MYFEKERFKKIFENTTDITATDIGNQLYQLLENTEDYDIDSRDADKAKGERALKLAVFILMTLIAKDSNLFNLDILSDKLSTITSNF